VPLRKQPHTEAGRSWSRAAEIAAEFVRLKVDIIVATGFAHISAAKQATSVIPIVFPATGDPVATGLVASLARPGGNATGLSVQATDLAGKRIEILRELVPGLRRLAIIANAGNPNTVLQVREARVVALAARHAIPAIYAVREFVVVGRLMELWRKHRRGVSASRHLCGAGSQRREAGRSAGRAIR
jgi:ABC-type uncharacterized transport system substrate-binding protein